MSIKVNHVFFAYQKHGPDTLKDISLNIANQSLNVILGLNGSGKTTLIKVLAGICETKRGEVYYGSTKLNTLTYKERSKIVSYVGQYAKGIEDVKVKDYLAYGLLNSFAFYQSPKEKEMKQVNEIAKKLGIEYLLDKTLGNISGGERQIVSIASALAQNAKVILLDEPTSALDLKNQSVVLALLKRIVASEKRTVILSTHNPNHALLLNANVILIDSGKILEVGSAKKIIKLDKLRKIYGVNFKLGKDFVFKV
ncbi:MAG: ABC transporter ATP-binding protein [Bacilli bacterium]|nr:ABC transporter ATP-binding protein [Bacilli bacterium]